MGAIFYRGGFPLVLGGTTACCLATFSPCGGRGRYGLVFLDAHYDFYLPEQSPTGQASDSDLALVTGRGPEHYRQP